MTEAGKNSETHLVSELSFDPKVSKKISIDYTRLQQSSICDIFKGVAVK